MASGVAFGAAVVWTSSFPFADAAIGQVIPTNSLGPTGSTGATGTSETGATGGTATTGPTGTGTGTSGGTGTTPPPTDAAILAGLREVTNVRVGKGGISFAQKYAEDGRTRWAIDMTFFKPSVKGAKVQRPIRVASGSGVVKAGKRYKRLKLSKNGRKAMKAHKGARLVLRTTFSDARGKKFSSNHVLRSVTKKR